MELPKRIFGAEYLYLNTPKHRRKGFVIYQDFGNSSGAIKNSVHHAGHGGADGARLYIGEVTWRLAAEHGDTTGEI